MPIFEFFASLGIVYGLIFLFLSIGAVALIIILFMDLRMADAIPPEFVDELIHLVKRRQLDQAYDLAKNDTSFVASALRAGISKMRRGLDAAHTAMVEDVERTKVGKNAMVSYLTTVAMVGPLLGLMGTISGIIGRFRDLGQAPVQPNAMDFAQHISSALVPLLVGITISVPAIFFFTLFKNRLHTISAEVTRMADDLLNRIDDSADPTPHGASSIFSAGSHFSRRGSES